MIGKNESETLRMLLDEFFSISPVKKTLKFIGNQDILGCERWLQIELLRFLCEHPLVVKEEVCKEEPFDYDQRKELHAIRQKVDITFRIKNKQYYHAVELKHKNCLAVCDVVTDLAKIIRAKPSQKVYFRKIFSLLVHPYQDQNTIEKKLDAKEFGSDLEFTFKIPTTNLSCTVFSAEV